MTYLVTDPRYDADELLRRMRSDRDSDWPYRLLRAISVLRERSCELSLAERDAVNAASHGLDYAMIAATLGKDEDTVRTQLKSARRRLGAKNTTHAVALALRAGIIA